MDEQEPVRVPKTITVLSPEELRNMGLSQRPLHEGRRGDPCVYCGGAASGTTMDHVFPKTLFSPVPTNAITAPACRPCNAEKAKGDEHLRVVSIMSKDAMLMPRDMAHMDKIARAIQTNRSPIARAAHDAYRLRKQVDPLNLGGDLPMTFDGTALDMTLEMMMRGMFYKVHGRILPADCPITAAPLPQEEAPKWVAIIASDPDMHNGERGGRTVQWLMTSTDFRDEHTAMALFLLRGGVFYIAGSGHFAGDEEVAA